MKDHQVSTNEIMEFLQDHMVMKEEFENKMNNQKMQILDSIDEKLGTLKGDLVVMMRGEDKKFVLLVEKLRKRQVLDENDAKELLSMHPFPQIAI